MLTHLHIRDLAIIDAVDIDLQSGLTVLTGETGAGKSIIVDALTLIAGGRASADMVRHGAERAELTATFDLSGAPARIAALLEEQSIATDGELIVRRLVTADGKSRAWLAGQPVPIQLLRSIAEPLLDIHGQHEFQSLTRPAAQRDLLDSFGGHEASLQAVASAARTLRALRQQLSDLERAAQDRDARLDLLRYQSGELAAADLKGRSLQSLTEERERLAHRGKLAEAAQTAAGHLYEAEDGNAYAAIARALAPIRNAAHIDPRLAELLPQLEEASLRVTEAARHLNAYLESLEVDPARQDEVEQTLATLEQLARKHRIPLEALAARHQQLQHELLALERVSTDLIKVREQHDALYQTWHSAAQTLSAKRQTTAQRLSKAITTRMQGLGMIGGRCVIEVAQLTAGDGKQMEASADGLDRVEFLVAANPGQPPKPVAKVASGGELSRLSLAVQVASATQAGQRAAAPRCMVFDEVDAGVGGAVAEIVGRELAALGAHVQVLCVTHLAQVAAQASHQLRVAKLTDGKTTRTTVTTLNAGERVAEVARMLGGIEVTRGAREHAAEMLSQTHSAAPRRKTK